jgi:choline monooxygenase
MARYGYELGRYAILQLAEARDGDAAFDAAAARPTTAADRRVLLVGVSQPDAQLLSVGAVAERRAAARARPHPRALSRYVHDPARLGGGAGADLDQVEREDEAAVESVQQGLRSRLYRDGRYSPRTSAACTTSTACSASSSRLSLSRSRERAGVRVCAAT